MEHNRHLKWRVWDETNRTYNYVNLRELLSMDFRVNLLDTDIWERFTGKQDRNGTDVYEGDILGSTLIQQWRGPIEWNEEDASFQMIGVPTSSMSSISRLEIKGNIRENGDLL